jgi:hypothetical protein
VEWQGRTIEKSTIGIAEKSLQKEFKSLTLWMKPSTKVAKSEDRWI